MTAWAQLILHSTLPSGTAWEHLNAQSAGSGLIVNDGIAVEVEASQIDVEIDTGEMDVTVEDSPIDTQVDDSPIYVEVQE